MPSYLKHDVILVQYPFSDLSRSKVRPAVVVSASHPSQDIIITPLTSKTDILLPGEFVLSDWLAAALNTVTAVKRGIYTVQGSLTIKVLGQLVKADAMQLEQSLQAWLGLASELS